MARQHIILNITIICGIVILFAILYNSSKMLDGYKDSGFVKLPISAGILTYYAPKTLAHTLQTYKDSGFIDLIDDLFVVIQKSSRQQEEKKVCESFNIRYVLMPHNGQMASGFKAIYKDARNEILLFLENDFCIYESKNEVNEFLVNSIDFLNNGNDIVRGRNRSNPGDPNWATQNIKDSDPEILVNHSHLSECIYWVTDPETVYSSKIKKVKPLLGNKSWYATTSKSCNYTNNPFLCKRGFFKSHIFPYLYFGENIEDRLTPIWGTENHKCIMGPGLFTHDRSYDGHS